MATAEGVTGWSRLTAAVGEQALLSTVEDVHRSISDGAFRFVGPPGRPLQRVHDHLVGMAYDAVRIALRSAGELGAMAAIRVTDDRDTPLTGRALKARAIAHGVVSEEILAHSPELDLEVTLRLDGAEVTPDRPSLAAAYPQATGTLMVFVHGLVDSEEVWQPRAPEAVSLPAIAEEAGATTVMIRYGTGRAIGRNGADLALLLEDVTRNWPVPITRLVVVGHSMGGLVTRAACAAAVAQDHTWLGALSDVVYLGTPHLGSWLEKSANVGGWVLRRASTRTAPIAALLEQRSRGIKDLRHGTLVEQGWGEVAVDDLLSGLVPDEPWLDGVNHHLVVGRLRPSARHPLTAVFGDALVRAGSARGAGSHRRIADGGPVTIREVDASHTALMCHLDVGTLLGEVVARPEGEHEVAGDRASDRS